MSDKKFFLTMMNAYGAHRDSSLSGFRALGLSDGQPKILYILYNSDGYVQNELAKRCNLKPSTMTVALERLEADGYIKKEQTHVSGGKSAKRVSLTEKGRRRAEEVTALTEELEEKCFKGFSDEEKQTLFTLLERVTENLK